MNCPACNKTLEEVRAENLLVDICSKGCGGIWFDAHEFKKADEKTETAGDVLVAMTEASYPKPLTTNRYKCPRDAMIMMRHFHSVKRKVTIDVCPKCAGIWLDNGELAEIRAEYATEDGRKEDFRKELAKRFELEFANQKQTAPTRLEEQTNKFIDFVSRLNGK